jgi:hypothetical protein
MIEYLPRKCEVLSSTPQSEKKKVWSLSHWLKARYRPGGLFWGENAFPCLFRLLEASWIPRHMAPSSIFRVHHANHCFCDHIPSLLWSNLLLPHSYKDPSGYIFWHTEYDSIQGCDIFGRHYSEWSLHLQVSFYVYTCCIYKTLWATWGQGCTLFTSIFPLPNTAPHTQEMFTK